MEGLRVGEVGRGALIVAEGAENRELGCVEGGTRVENRFLSCYRQKCLEGPCINVTKPPISSLAKQLTPLIWVEGW